MASIPGMIPPWKSSGGSFYARSSRSGDVGSHGIWKADGDDPASTWTEQDTAGRPVGNNQKVSTYQDGDLIHIASWVGLDYEYSVFNMATDNWDVAGELIDSPADAPTQAWISISVRSDGDVGVVYAGATDRVMGGDKERVDANIRSGSPPTWGGPIALDAALDFHYGNPNVVKGALTDDMHILWAQTANVTDPPSAWAQVEARTLDPADSLSTLDTDPQDPGSGLLGMQNAVAYNDASTSPDTQRMLWHGVRALAGNARIYFPATEDGSDDVVLGTATLDAAVATRFNGEVAITTIAELSGDIHELFSGGGIAGVDQDIYYTKSTDDGVNWDTPTEELDAVTCNFISANIYTRGGDTVLAYVYDDGGVTKYNEKVLVAGGFSAIAQASFALRPLLAAAKTAAQIGAASVALRPAAAATKVSTSQPSVSIALRTIIEAVGALVVNAVALVRIALRPFPAGAKTADQIAKASLQARAISAAGKTSTGTASARLAMRSLIDGIRAFNAAIRASFALRGQAAAGKVSDQVAAASLALRSAPEGAKTAAQAIAASIALRGSGIAEKVASGAITASLALRTLVDAAGGLVFNAIAIVHMALRSAGVAGKTTGGDARSSVALRAADAAAKTSTGAASVRIAARALSVASKTAQQIVRVALALRTLVDATGGIVINAIAIVRLALRTADAADKTTEGIASASIATRALSAASKAVQVIVHAGLAVRTSLDAGITSIFNAAVRASIALRASPAAASTKISVIRAGLALRSAGLADKTIASAIVGRLAIRSANSGQKTIAGVAFNRMALRTSIAALPGELGSISLVIPLDGLFDPTCAFDGLFDPESPLSGEVDPV